MKMETAIHMAETAESNGNYFAAHHFYVQALEKLTPLKRTPEKDVLMKRLKKKSRETAKKIEMKKFSQEMPETSIEAIEKRYKELLDEKDSLKALHHFGREVPFFSFNKHLEAAKRHPAIFLQIATTVVIDEKGDRLEQPEEPEEHIAWSTFNNMLEAYTIRDILVISHRLRQNGKLTLETTLAFLDRETNPMNEDERGKLKVALHRYFVEDYISALHILVPTFEGFFLRLSDEFSPTISEIMHRLPPSGLFTKTRTLGEAFLEDTEVRRLWGAEFCDFLKAFLLSDMSFRMRHKVAHGEISVKECTLENCTIVFYLFLSILSRIKRKS